MRPEDLRGETFEDAGDINEELLDVQCQCPRCVCTDRAGSWSMRLVCGCCFADCPDAHPETGDEAWIRYLVRVEQAASEANPDAPVKPGTIVRRGFSQRG